MKILPHRTQVISDMLGEWKNTPSPDINPWIQKGDSIMGCFRLSDTKVADISGPHKLESGEEGWHVTVQEENDSTFTLPFCRHIKDGILMTAAATIFSARSPEGKPRGIWTEPENKIVWELESFQCEKIEVQLQCGEILCDSEDRLLHKDQTSPHFQDTKVGKKKALEDAARLAVLGDKLQETEMACEIGNARHNQLCLRYLGMLHKKVQRIEQSGTPKEISEIRNYISNMDHSATNLPREAWEYLQENITDRPPIPLGKLPSKKEEMRVVIQSHGTLEVIWDSPNGPRSLHSNVLFRAFESQLPELTKRCEELVKDLTKPQKPKKKKEAPVVGETQEPEEYIPPLPNGTFLTFEDGSHATFTANCHGDGCHGAISETGYYSHSGSKGNDPKTILTNRRKEFEATAKTNAKRKPESVADILKHFEVEVRNTYRKEIIALAQSPLNSPDSQFTIYHGVNGAHDAKCAWEGFVLAQNAVKAGGQIPPKTLHKIAKLLHGCHAPMGNTQGLKFLGQRYLRRLARHTTLTGHLQGIPYELKPFLHPQMEWQEAREDNLPPRLNARDAYGKLTLKREEKEDEPNEFDFHLASTNPEDEQALLQLCGLIPETEVEEPKKEKPAAKLSPQIEFAF